MLIVNGLPLVVLDLKNPADENATIWKAFEQLQTYKGQIPDLFEFNEILVISDGSQALMGSLTSDPERFMRWRTIDGVTLDPLDLFNELDTMVRGLLQLAVLLDYLRYFVLFKDGGGQRAVRLPSRRGRGPARQGRRGMAHPGQRFMQAVKVILTKRELTAKKLRDGLSLSSKDGKTRTRADEVY